MFIQWKKQEPKSEFRETWIQWKKQETKSEFTPCHIIIIYKKQVNFHSCTFWNQIRNYTKQNSEFTADSSCTILSYQAIHNFIHLMHYPSTTILAIHNLQQTVPDSVNSALSQFQIVPHFENEIQRLWQFKKFRQFKMITTGLRDSDNSKKTTPMKLPEKYIQLIPNIYSVCVYIYLQ